MQEFVKFLGKGAYGQVHLVRYIDSNGCSFPLARKTSYAYDSLEKEIQVLTELSGYPNIVQCFGNELEQSFDQEGNRVYRLLLEYASEGCLSNFMNKYPDRKLPVSMIRVFTSMILEGLVRIHSHGYVHCDLKSDNLLVFPLSDDDYELKISDFGSVLEVGQVPDYWAFDRPWVGTPIYMPPESLRNGVAEKTLDLWSLGCLVLEMFTGVKPWNRVGTDESLTNLLLQGKAPDIPEWLPCNAKDFIETCFSRKPEDRGSAPDLLCHRFLCLGEEKITVKIVSDVTVGKEIEDNIVSDSVVVKETKGTEEKTLWDFVIIEEPKSNVCAVEESRRVSSLLLKLQLKLSMRTALKKPMIFGLFEKFLRVKTMPLNSVAGRCVV